MQLDEPFDAVYRRYRHGTPWQTAHLVRIRDHLQDSRMLLQKMHGDVMDMLKPKDDIWKTKIPEWCALKKALCRSIKAADEPLYWLLVGLDEPTNPFSRQLTGRLHRDRLLSINRALQPGLQWTFPDDFYFRTFDLEIKELRGVYTDLKLLERRRQSSNMLLATLLATPPPEGPSPFLVIDNPDTDQDGLQFAATHDYLERMRQITQ